MASLSEQITKPLVMQLNGTVLGQALIPIMAAGPQPVLSINNGQVGLASNQAAVPSTPGQA